MTTKVMKQMELDAENSTSIRVDGMHAISETIQHVLQRCTEVTDVSIRHSTLTNTALTSICQLMRGRLLSLDLHGTKGFGDVGIKALAAYCSQIQTLRVGGGCAVSASGLGESARGWNPAQLKCSTRPPDRCSSAHPAHRKHNDLPLASPCLSSRGCTAVVAEHCKQLTLVEANVEDGNKWRDLLPADCEVEDGKQSGGESVAPSAAPAPAPSGD